MKNTGLFWWIDRWRKSSAFMDMTLEQQGAYRNLLDEAHLRGGALPDDDRILAKACGDALAWERVGPVVIARFELRADGWHNATLDAIIAKTAQLSTERSKAGVEGNRKRWRKRIATDIAKPVANASSPDPDPDPYSGTVSGSGKEQKIRTAPAARPAGNGNGNGHGRKPKDNLRVITKLVHTVLADINQPQDFASLKADIKTQCALKHIAYDAEVVGRALESALAQRKHA